MPALAPATLRARWQPKRRVSTKRPHRWGSPDGGTRQAGIALSIIGRIIAQPVPEFQGSFRVYRRYRKFTCKDDSDAVIWAWTAFSSRCPGVAKPANHAGMAATTRPMMKFRMSVLFGGRRSPAGGPSAGSALFRLPTNPPHPVSGGLRRNSAFQYSGKLRIQTCAAQSLALRARFEQAPSYVCRSDT